MTKKHIWLSSIGLLLFLATAGIILWQQHALSVEAVYPVRGPAIYAVYATGTVEATVMMPIAPRTTARLITLESDEGNNVKKGQLLAQLEDNDLQKSIEQLQAREIYARSIYTRNRQLSEKNYVSKDELERAKSEWQAAKASVQKVEAEAGYLKLVAPADGKIISRDGEIGQLIPVNQPVFWISCCAPLRISTEVDEEDIAKVEAGQKVLIRADAFPDQTFYGKVQSITPKGNPIARSYRVRVEFTGEVPLQIGMTAETNIIINERKNALLLPVTAVENNTIWVIENNRLRQQPVTLGIKGLEQVEITDGLTDNDLIVLKPNNQLRKGKKVRSTIIPKAT